MQDIDKNELYTMVMFQLLQNFTQKNMDRLIYVWTDQATVKTTRKNLEKML